MVKSINLTCIFCCREHSVLVNKDSCDKWVDGELIQNAMPELNPTQREQLISKICPDCQDGLFD
jgi:hypothetical protein